MPVSAPWTIVRTIMMAIVLLHTTSMLGCDTIKRVFEVYDSTKETTLTNFRLWDMQDEKRKFLLLMVHGFNSSNGDAWGDFPKILYTDRDTRLAGFNIIRYGYGSKVCRNKVEISTLGDGLSSFLIDETGKYEGIIVISHSMGGLVVMEALTRLARDKNKILNQLPIIVMTFGTPYLGVNGAAKLGELRLLCEDKQAPAMNEFNKPLGDLRALYDSYFEDHERFQYHVTMKRYYGDSDNFVTQMSACAGLFSGCKQVEGNHAMIVKPSSPDHLVPYMKLLAQLPKLRGTVDGMIPTAPRDFRVQIQ